MNDINEVKMAKKLMKKDFNKLGLTLFMQWLINFGVIFLIAIGVGIVQFIINPSISEEQAQQIFKNSSFLGTISIITVIIAFIPILIYRRNEFFQYDIKIENKKFTSKTVIIGFLILLSVNSALGLFASGLEFALNKFGLTAASALEDLDILNQLTIPMTIYTCIIAPIFEEFIYRGAVLRSLEKYGRWFAILISAILFGLMHGNFYQIFMATGIGIALGYLATEYSIKLTILLHMINNTFVGVTSLISSHISENAGNIMNAAIILISLITLVIAFILKKNHIGEWLQNNKMEKGIMLKFLTSIAIIIVIAIDIITVISGIERIS